MPPRNAIQGTDCNGRTLEFSAEYRWLADMTLTGVRPVPVPRPAGSSVPCPSCARTGAAVAEAGADRCPGCGGVGR
jgi:hypothetical protein